MKLLLSLFLCIASALPLTAQDTQSWPVRLTFPRHSGERYNLTATVNQNMTVNLRVNGQVVRDQSIDSQLSFRGMIEITAVNDEQLATTALVTVDKLTATQAGKEEELLPTGTIVRGEFKDGDVTYTLNNEPVPGIVGKSLASLLLIYDGRHTTDEVFGTTEAVTLGQSWPLDAQLAAENATNQRFTPQAEDITGSSTLNAVEQVNGGSCLRIVSTMNIQQLNPPRLPPDMTLDKGTLDLTTNTLLPLGTDKGPLEKSSNATIAFAASRQDGDEESHFTFELKEDRSEQYQFL